MHLSADIIMYLSHNCEVLEDLYMLNSIQLACNLVSVASVAFSTKTSTLDMMRALDFCLKIVHVTSVPALTLLIIIACGHQDSAVFQHSSCQVASSLLDIL